MYARVKRARRGEQVHEYVQLVEGHREGGKVRQRVVATLGRLDELKASGQLDRFAGSFARLDPPAVGTSREVGPLLLVAHYLRRLGLAELVDEVAPMRGRSLLTHGEVVAVLVANRLCAPAPLYDISGWASSAGVAELFGVPSGLLNDDRLGRALDALAPHAEDLRGRLLLRTIERCEVDASRLHLDLTAVRFAGHYEGSSLVKKGWAAGRSIERQVKALQASTKSGVALYFRPHQGASSELPAFMAGIETLAGALPPGLVVVGGSGLGYLENLCALDSAKVSFVVPLRADTGWAQRFVEDVPAGLGALKHLDYCSERERRLPLERRTAWKGLVCPFPVTDGSGRRHDLRVAYIFSSEEASSVKAARERALKKAEDALGRVRNGLGGRYYKTKKQVDDRVAVILSEGVNGLIDVSTAEGDAKPTLSWSRNEEATGEAGVLDGLYALVTNIPDLAGQRLSALDVLKTYKDQWVVEQRHRDLKQALRARPVFLHNDARIEALIAVIGIALLVFGLIEAELRAALGEGASLPGILPEGRAAKPTARAALASFDGLSVTYTPNGLALDRLTQVQRVILALLDIPLPWPEGAED
ncbi:MAG: IS1634 family transposase [Acidimicrobiales bacterium]